jgi:hypothetical protein
MGMRLSLGSCVPETTSAILAASLIIPEPVLLHETTFLII